MHIIDIIISSFDNFSSLYTDGIYINNNDIFCDFKYIQDSTPRGTEFLNTITIKRTGVTIGISQIQYHFLYERKGYTIFYRYKDHGAYTEFEAVSENHNENIKNLKKKLTDLLNKNMSNDDLELLLNTYTQIRLENI